MAAQPCKTIHGPQRASHSRRDADHSYLVEERCPGSGEHCEEPGLCRRCGCDQRRRRQEQRHPLEWTATPPSRGQARPGSKLLLYDAGGAMHCSAVATESDWNQLREHGYERDFHLNRVSWVSLLRSLLETYVACTPSDSEVEEGRFGTCYSERNKFICFISRDAGCGMPRESIHVWITRLAALASVRLVRRRRQDCSKVHKFSIFTLI